MPAKLLPALQSFLPLSPNLDPKTYQLHTIHQTGAQRTDPTRIKGAQNKGLQENPHG